VELLQNHEASEAVFKRSAPGRRVLHLATHGFFLGSDCATPAVGTRGVGGLATASGRRSNAGTADNPLLLSGLALAGANRRAAAGPEDEDGILTAEEVASGRALTPPRPVPGKLTAERVAPSLATGAPAIAS
jgi:hypothetical protein